MTTLMTDVQVAGIKSLRAAHGLDIEHKYLDVETWIEKNRRRIASLGLDDDTGPRRVLDIGCGAGYFACMCRSLGHDVVAADLPKPAPLFVAVTAVLGVPVVPVTVQPFVALPELGTFDVITSFMICFNGHRSQRVWKIPEWTFFLDDLRSRLRAGGVIGLELNREPNGMCYTPELEAWFRTRGAVIAGHRLVFRR